MKFLLLSLSILTAGCAAQVSKVAVINCINTITYSDGKLQKHDCDSREPWRVFNSSGYSIRVPGNVYKFVNNQSNIVFDTNPTNSKAQPTDYRISLYTNLFTDCHKLSKSQLLDIFPDDPESKLISSTILLDEPNSPEKPFIVWGKDDTDGRLKEVLENTCECTDQENCDVIMKACLESPKSDFGIPENRYILCAERLKDNKPESVVISLDPKTDDPNLAKQIFESFKWTDK